MKRALLFLAAITCILFITCTKRIETGIEEKTLAASEISGATAARLLYADTIFYVKNQPGNYFIRPISKPGRTGYFKAIPLGLVYDSISGRINVTKSETGLKYKMYYLSPVGNRIDSTQLIISGIDYADGIYDLGLGQTKALPVYAANPSIPIPCDDDDDDDDEGDDDDDDCEFDERDLDDNGTNDIPGANSLGFRVNRKTAVINLAATLTAGALGTNPQNGAKGDFLFYYRLQDASNRALQDITVRLYYYKRKGAIPDSLLSELNARKAQDNDVNNRYGSFASTGTTSTLKYVEPRPKRPPLIILVGTAPAQ